ncbi:conserved hypothetical protein [Neospora caninum Liverpool]|uniref:AMP-dependent synthetase/ligase domain-containing protein n=1 Tax=Neospora caninum (strain Liverpool) TaxID=572307 RepID=F0VEY9_NEOCL|nr:conserved hypothetical protein [Neospora caninum Liverpool]CBZ52283.1 conserved hypothetical protein [Neospora caninum Liverpool]|eukprot:XP_003882315.1 conserved hypothetical protein [Neospora caninum Liverpool]
MCAGQHTRARSLEKHRDRLFDVGASGQPITYQEVAEHARTISEALQAAAAYLHVTVTPPALRGQGAKGGPRHISTPSEDCAGAASVLECHEKPLNRATIGLIVPPNNVAILAHLLGVWQCGGVGILLPFPDPESLPFVADSTAAATASAANAAVLFGKGGKTLHTYRPDALVQGNTGPSVYGKTINPNSLPYSASQNGAHNRNNLERCAQLWEYQAAESQCRLLVVAPEVAPVAGEVAAKLSVPICVLRTCVGRAYDDANDAEGPREAEANSQERGLWPVRGRKKLEAKAYVPEVLHDSSRASNNIARWRLLESTAHQRTDSAATPSKTNEESFTEVDAPATHFFQGSAAHAPRAVVYSHKALSDQVVRNRELLHLTADDHVVILHLPSSGPPRNGADSSGSMRMLCTPKGLVAVALPAVAAGSALSLLASSDKLQDSFLPLPLQLQALQDRLPEGEKLPPQPEQRQAVLPIGYDSTEKASTRTTARGPWHVSERQEGSKVDATCADPNALEANALQMWERIACLHEKGRNTTRCRNRQDSKCEKAPLDASRQATVLAMDAATAATMLKVFETERRGARSERAHTAGVSHASRFSTVTSRDLARYRAAAKTLRLICICTDEGDLGASFSNRWSSCNQGGVIRIQPLLRRWQAVAGPDSKILHLCSLTETGLLMVGGPLSKDNPRSSERGEKADFGEVLHDQLSPNCRDSNADSLEATDWMEREDFTGYIAPGVQVEIDDETDQLRVRSGHMATGFHGRPRSTQESFDSGGLFRSSFGGSLVTNRPEDAGDGYGERGSAEQRVELFKCVYSAAVPRVPLLHRLIASFKNSPKMESHIEGYIKKKPIAGRDWNNLHAPRKHWKKMFL